MAKSAKNGLSSIENVLTISMELSSAFGAVSASDTSGQRVPSSSWRWSRSLPGAFARRAFTRAPGVAGTAAPIPAAAGDTGSESRTTRGKSRERRITASSFISMDSGAVKSSLRARRPWNSGAGFAGRPSEASCARRCWNCTSPGRWIVLEDSARKSAPLSVSRTFDARTLRGPTSTNRRNPSACIRFTVSSKRIGEVQISAASSRAWRGLEDSGAAVTQE